MPTEEFFCYADETGQDTRATAFIVSVVITDTQRDMLAQEFVRIERASSKGKEAQKTPVDRGSSLSLLPGHLRVLAVFGCYLIGVQR